jgi:hypothetical protein
VLPHATLYLKSPSHSVNALPNKRVKLSIQRYRRGCLISRKLTQEPPSSELGGVDRKPSPKGLDVLEWMGSDIAECTEMRVPDLRGDIETGRWVGA